MIHVHIRGADATPTLDLQRLEDTVAALRAETNLVVQLSTGGAVTDPEDHRLRVLDAMPDSASCTMGTVNFGDDVFMNRWEFIVELHKRMPSAGSSRSTRSSTSASSPRCAGCWTSTACRRAGTCTSTW